MKQVCHGIMRDRKQQQQQREREKDIEVKCNSIRREVICGDKKGKRGHQRAKCKGAECREKVSESLGAEARRPSVTIHSRRLAPRDTAGGGGICLILL